MPTLDPEKAKLAKLLSGPSLPFDPEQMSFVRLRQADFARLMGVSRATVCQWVKSGRITARLDGTIDPNKAVGELLKDSDIKTARSKVLHAIHAEVRDTNERAALALAELGRLTALQNEQRRALRLVLRRWLEAESWLSGFARLVEDSGVVDGPAVERLFDEAGRTAIGAPLSDLEAAGDPEVLALVSTVDPDCGLTLPAAHPAEPRAHGQTGGRALSGLTT